MNKKGKALAGIFAVLLVGLIVWAVNGIPEPPDVGDTPSQRIVNFDGNTISEEKNGKIIWTVTAENIEMDIDTKDASLINVKAVYNFEDGRTVELKAPKAIYKEKDHHLEITDGVEGKSSDGGKFSCKEVEWLSDKDMLAMKGDGASAGDVAVEFTAEDVIGSWEFTKGKTMGVEVTASQTGQAMSLVLKEGGKASMTTNGNANDHLEWRIEDGVIILGVGTYEAFRLTYDGTVLILNTMGVDMIFERVD